MSVRALPPSLWADTAPPAPPAPPLAESRKVDVLIVGGGFTGLSAALHLAEAGVQACVLEAHEPGWGASGRNGGQVNPSLKHDPEDLVRIYGPERAEPLIDAVSRSADLVFELIARHGIDCQPVRNGWLQVAYSPKDVAGLHARARQWAKLGVRTEQLDHAAVSARLGTEAFAGGWLDGRAGSIQPLAYTRGLVCAAQAAGASVHGGTEVTALERRGSHWHASTSTGASVTAEQVLIATNGYTGALWPKLQRTVLAANSFIVATEPLKGAAADAILPGGETASTSQRLLLYFRKDAQGRLLMGGRGHFADPAGPADFAHLERSLELLFPQLGPLRYEYRWAGRIAVTRDFMPHVHTPAPGVTVALGYNGRGIALATSMGRHVAARIAGSRDGFPYPVTPIQPIPLHGLQRFYIAGGVAWYSLLDRLA
ncbi:FAD-binding oxidoreductase [Variovorax sp. NFACC27]|uniref:NAD(P)/FAD-dependent oxidoreductase n=1 Tax=unclassified Variovorax TaxID=663243 RepID=UPI00089CA4EC|nr:FAD dependent oxidoreductase [Variovorax sp. NFACC28]SEG88002.1 FAD dependent oxidoreductase [Variovorax sp. NFACC29]SFD26714.1 FAD dependent oxidoreductase [Variovorax sp. NFACC26]SFG35156.1 FAD dependent oxidoreductase [Variovorax sp. NFACC27]